MKKRRKVNRMLDVSPMFFGMISIDLILPLGGFIVLGYVFFMLTNNWICSAVVFLTCITSYAILTIKGPHIYLSRLLQSPPKYIRLPLPFVCFLEKLNDIDRQKNTQTNSKKRTKR
jgi:Ca2+/Na+ antiporter